MVDTTLDAWLGSTTVTTVMDAALMLTTTLYTNADAALVRSLDTTMDAFVINPLGQYRGLVTVAQRDALEALQPGDVVAVGDDE